jgi:predicted nucleotidyltransferase
MTSSEMNAPDKNTAVATQDPVLQALVRDLAQALGPRLKSVVLYGSAARGDHHPAASDLNVILVLESLVPASLEALAPAVRRFVRKGHPVPRLFSPALIAASADSFPVEFADIRAGRKVLHGVDAFAGVVVARTNLRLQIEREMKEKMMRLHEGYVMVHDHPARLRHLLVESYPAFAALFRGGLHLMGRPVPSHSHDVVVAFCEAAGLERAPFDAVAGLRRGDKGTLDVKTLFARYDDQLTRAAERVNRLNTQGGETK